MSSWQAGRQGEGRKSRAGALEGQGGSDGDDVRRWEGPASLSVCCVCVWATGPGGVYLQGLQVYQVGE